MKPGELELKVVSGDGSGTVHLAGELDLSSAPKLRRTLDGLFREDVTSLVLDLSELDFIDSTGLSELVVALKHCRHRGGDVVLRSPTRATTRVLALCGLDRVFSVSPPESGSSAS